MSWDFYPGMSNRLELRECREDLLRRWALKGFFDVASIQEHFKNDDSPIFHLFGPDC